MLDKFKNFLNSDIRWKLIKLTKFTKINFYPNYHHKKGFRSFYTRFIANLIFREKMKKIKKNIFKEIFKDQISYDKEKVNFLISTPSSGSTYVRLMLQSYFELLHNIGNGTPKYDNINNFMFFSGSQLQSPDLWNQITVERGRIDNTNFVKHEDYEKEKFVMSRFPLERIDLYKINQIRPVVLFRDPIDQIISSYTSHTYHARKVDNSKEFFVNSKILVSRINNYDKYINYWKNFFKNHKKNQDYLVINYKQLVNDSSKSFKEILLFFNYQINDEYIETCAKIHSKENTIQNLKNVKIYNKIRFTDPQAKENQKKIILPILEEKIKKTNITEIYNDLFK